MISALENPGEPRLLIALSPPARAVLRPPRVRRFDEPLGVQVEEVSDEEKLQIAQHYLLNAPPGQFDEVLKGKAKPQTPNLDSRDTLLAGAAGPDPDAPMATAVLACTVERGACVERLRDPETGSVLCARRSEGSHCMLWVFWCCRREGTAPRGPYRGRNACGPCPGIQHEELPSHQEWRLEAYPLRTRRS